MTKEAKMKKAIRKVFEAMQGQAGEMKSDFETYHRLVHAVISNLGEFRGDDAEVAESVAGSPEPRKTGFDFGATKVPPKKGDSYWLEYGNGPKICKWNDDRIDWDLLGKGKVFLYPTDCQAYINYIESNHQ